ncbi:hypothetical protein [Streptomyces telluris]|uniref:Lipoprotein n=1 Tax=Streptomyces telluris TaxID=2720021 RepID=A0A9X2RLZ7_9ACTN|nr:hypothetical protein [Streptomyces telluris]MCQ8768600.1 hypothetical protein [Streptomyces telluris]NJP81343.1 hypothetical protein [Streptomyces telluris]
MAFTTTTRGPAGPHRRRVLAGGAAVLLSAGAGALLTGCSGASGASSGPSAAERLRAAAGRDSAQLLARYDATIAAHGALAERLRPLREEVARHAEAFGASRGASGAPRGGTAPAASGPLDGSASAASSAPSVSSGTTSEPSESPESPESSEASEGPKASGSPESSSSESSSSAAPGASASGASASAHTDGVPDRVPGDEKGALAALADAERRTADSRTKALGSAPPELARLLASVAAAGAAHAYLLRSDA